MTLEKQDLSKLNAFNYTVADVYLGKNGKVVSKDEIFEIHFCYSERDGIYWKFKSKMPYKVLFEYNDGLCLINDFSTYDYKELSSQLEIIRENAHSQHYSQTYHSLEDITYLFLEKYFIKRNSKNNEN